MLKIYKDKISRIALSGALICSLGTITGCTSKYSLGSNTSGNNSANQSIETAVYFDGDVAIIISGYGFDPTNHSSFGIHNFNVDSNYDAYFPASDLIIFKGQDSYNDAYNFASTLTDTVYLYDDVMNGKPVNILDASSKELTK